MCISLWNAHRPSSAFKTSGSLLCEHTIVYVLVYNVHDDTQASCSVYTVIARMCECILIYYLYAFARILYCKEYNTNCVWRSVCMLVLLDGWSGSCVVCLLCFKFHSIKSSIYFKMFIVDRLMLLVGRRWIVRFQESNKPFASTKVDQLDRIVISESNIITIE